MSRISIASWEILSVDKDEDYEDEVDVRLAFPQSNKALWIAVTQNSNATHFQPNLPRIQQHGAHAYRIMLESCAKSQAYLPTAASFHSLVAISLKPVCAFFHYSAQVTHQLTLPWSFGPEPSWHMVPNTEFRRDLRIPYTTARQTQPASRADHIETPAVLSAARRLEELGHIDNALDVVFGFFDSMLRKREYSRVNSMLLALSPSNYGVDLLLGFLTITLTAKKHLPNRERLYENIEEELRHRGQLEEGLLLGLN